MRFLLYDIATSIVAPFGAARVALSPRHRPLLGRFGPHAPSFSDRPVWVHACSVGEVGVAKPIIEAMRRRWPEVPVLLTVSTVAGRRIAEASCRDVPLAWCPFDHRWIVARFVRRVRPRALVLVETEVWPNMVRAAGTFGFPVAIVNGRISDKHLACYRRYATWLRPVFSRITAAGMQNEEHAERVKALGVPRAAVHVTGNTKFDGVATEVDPSILAGLRAACGIDAGTPVIVFGSTRPGDEALAAACWKTLREDHPDLKCIVAPRHTERTEEAVAAFDEPVVYRSAAKEGRGPGTERVLVVDVMGELISFYAMATIAVIGGSFFPGVNGHNPLEPAALGVPTVFGPYMRNFADPARVLLQAGGARQVSRPEDLPGLLRSLLSDPAERAGMGTRARQAVLANQGAIARTLDMLDALIEGSSS